MAKEICQGKTVSGKQCKNVASESGYCKSHDPDIKKVKEKERRIMLLPRKRHDEVLSNVLSTCKAKGWDTVLKSYDRNNWQFATIKVSRYMNGLESGVLEITVDNGVKVAPHADNAFNAYGINSLHEAVILKLGELDWLESKEKKKKVNTPKSHELLIKILKNFDKVARQIKRRRDQRNTLIINDEYDVQDLLHAILKAVFDDIRPEEYTPSHAGSSSRVDFLLKDENIVIETKMASKQLTDKKVGEQLIVDIKKYQAHPNCKALYCLVYDPDNHINNPIGLENDLTRKHDGMDVYVVVIPQ